MNHNTLAAAAAAAGVDVALPGDYCTTPDSKPDPNVVCSVAAPICNAGFSGKCEAVPAESTQAITTGPSECLAGCWVSYAGY
jgi:hypothetical protein